MSLEVRHLYHTYQPGTPNERHALQGVDLSIASGEFIGLVGHTGSGKSTLIQHLNGLLKPTAGEILVEGVNIHAKSTDSKAIRLKVGLVFQYPEHQLFEETVERDIAFGPKNLGLDEAQIAARVAKVMQLVGLDYEAYRNKSPFELSGGEKRRVAIAGVLAMEPAVLILDEPTAGLDPKGRDDILAQVAALHKRLGVTVILVSHNMDDVAAYVDRLFVMAQGQIVLTGTPQRVFQERDQLTELGLGVPTVTELLFRLRAGGLDVPTDILDLQEAADAISQALAERGTRHVT